ncbi:Lon protease [compost metagenome]
MKTVLIPQENEKDLEDVPENVKAGLEIVPISTADEALKWALTGTPTPVEWDEAAEPLLPTAAAGLPGDAGASVSH